MTTPADGIPENDRKLLDEACKNASSFENTLADLRQCEQSEGILRPAKLSDTEREARAELIKLCAQIAEDYGDGE